MVGGEYTRPAILAALDGAISLGVLATSGLVSFPVALLATLAGTVSMAVGEFVSVENGLEGFSPWKASLGSVAGFLLGSLAPVLLVITGSVYAIFSGSALTLLALSLLVGYSNGMERGIRAAVLGSAALALSLAIGV